MTAYTQLVGIGPAEPLDSARAIVTGLAVALYQLHMIFMVEDNRAVFGWKLHESPGVGGKHSPG
jgi:hypothetical protein